MKVSEVMKKVKVWLKSTEAARTAAVNAEADKIVDEAKSAKKPFVVAELDLGADGKLAKKIQEKFKSVYPELSSVLLSSDDDGERYVYTNVSTSSSRSQVDLTLSFSQGGCICLVFCWTC